MYDIFDNLFTLKFLFYLVKFILSVYTASWSDLLSHNFLSKCTFFFLVFLINSLLLFCGCNSCVCESISYSFGTFFCSLTYVFPLNSVSAYFGLFCVSVFPKLPTDPLMFFSFLRLKC